MSNFQTSRRYLLVIALGITSASFIGFLVWPSAKETLAYAALGSSYIVFCLLVGLAADRMMRRPFARWTFLALLFTPFMAAVFLVAAGPDLAAYDQAGRVQDVEARAAIIDEDDAAAGSHLPSRRSLGIAVGGGLHSSDEESWRLICNECNRELEVEVLVQ